MNNTTALFITIFLSVAAACLGTGFLVASIVAGAHFAAVLPLVVVAGAGWASLYQIKQSA